MSQPGLVKPGLILGRKLCHAARAILQLVRLKAIAHHRLLWISEELIFTVLTVIHTGYLWGLV